MEINNPTAQSLLSSIPVENTSSILAQQPNVYPVPDINPLPGDEDDGQEETQETKPTEIPGLQLEAQLENKEEEETKEIDEDLSLIHI